MNLTVVSVCVGYDDYLSETLPYNRPHADSFIVVTDRRSEALESLASRYDLTLVETDRLDEGGAAFNKGKAVNDALRLVAEDAWVLLLDADVVLPACARSVLRAARLDPRALYGCIRQMCPSYAAWRRFQLSGLQGCGWEEAPRFRYSATWRRFWAGDEEPDDRFLPLGFFQLFARSSPSLPPGPVYPEDSPDAGQSDIDFGLRWPSVRFLEEIRVIHLPNGAPPFANWQGRKTLPFRDVEAEGLVLNPLSANLSKAKPGFHGEFESRYPDGTTAESGAFSNGLAEGEWSEFYEDGGVEARGTYSRGLCHGLWRRWSAAGRRVAALRYRKGRLHGRFTVWYPNGQRAAAGEYRRNRLHGPLLEWYPSGGLALMARYRDGRRHGPTYTWYENGQPALSLHYRDGREHGRYRLGHENGRAWVLGAYWHGRKHGLFLSWHDDGQKARQERFCNGTRVGDPASWDRLDEEDARLVPRGAFHHLRAAAAFPDVGPGPRRGGPERVTISQLSDALVGFEGLIFDDATVYLAGESFRESIAQLARASDGLMWSRAAGRVRVRSRLDLRWPAHWSIRGLHRHPGYARGPGHDRPPFVLRYDSLASVVQRCAASYFHWLLEVLPRIVLLRGVLDADPGIKLLIDYDFGGAIRNTWTDPHLDRLGIDRSRVVRYDPSKVYRADTLFVAGPVDAGRPDPSLLRTLRDALRPRGPRPPGGIVVAVNRSRDACRRILNWDALMEGLRKELGAEVVDFVAEEWDADAQAELFAGAGVILGAHGAGLANMIFAEPGALVVEIAPADYAAATCFAEAAVALGDRHERFVTSPSGPDDDFSVPVAAFLDAVIPWIDGRRATPPGGGQETTTTRE